MIPEKKVLAKAKPFGTSIVAPLTICFPLDIPRTIADVLYPKGRLFPPTERKILTESLAGKNDCHQRQCGQQWSYLAKLMNLAERLSGWRYKQPTPIFDGQI
jgi:hypothetical protein